MASEAPEVDLLIATKIDRRTIMDEDRYARLRKYGWQPGQSGNPRGRAKEQGSLSAALRRAGIRLASTRAELAKMAQKLGLDPEQARNIDVVAELIFKSITTLLLRVTKNSSRSNENLVGLLQILFRALDGDERKITLRGPSELRAALASVSAVLGFTQTDGQPPEGEPFILDHATDDPLNETDESCLPLLPAP